MPASGTERTQREDLEVTIRVVQWTTGSVGKQAGRAFGPLCGLPPLGIPATNDVDALLALEPDCVIYNPMWFNVDELVRILESGANVVATAAFINGQSYPDGGQQRLLDACAKGESSMFGS